MNYFKSGINSQHVIQVNQAYVSSTYNNTQSLHKPKSYNHVTLTQFVFKISPDVEPDIYHLFAYQNKEEIYYDVAFIPDYKTSVMMNKLFRKIKENDNLDAAEESDDEEEFENTSENKYVYLDRSFNINCVYNSKFKRWCPISLAKEDDKIVDLSLIQSITKKY